MPLVIEPPVADSAAALADTGVIKVESCRAVLHVTSECSLERTADLVAVLSKAL